MNERHPLIYNEFDIEAARNAGKSSEQSRIVKLLEAWLNDDNADFGETLALIKGENK